MVAYMVIITLKSEQNITTYYYHLVNQPNKEWLEMTNISQKRSKIHNDTRNILITKAMLQTV